jgi:hypothetical protein
MDRFRNWVHPYLRELPHGAAYLGLMMIVIIWIGAGFHLYRFKTQLLESVRLNSANLARASSPCLRTVMSMFIPTHSRMVPSAFNTGTARTVVQRQSPLI